MSNGPQAGAEHGGPAGTEYTLQGVMRFLQIEWHNHERLRNAWDIEREEMKQKIAKQEGTNKKLKRLSEILEKHIKILEKALREERAKTRALLAGEPLPTESESPKGKTAFRADSKKGITDSVKAPNKQLNSINDINHADSEAEKDAQLEKSRRYLTKCVEEITYLLLPPSHPPPASSLHSLANSTSYLHQGEAPMTMEEVFMQQRQKSQQYSNVGGAQPMPNHQPPPVPEAPQIPQGLHPPPHQAEYMTRESPLQTQLSQLTHNPHAAASPFPGAESIPQGFSSLVDDSLDRVPHGFDQLGRPVNSREDEPLSLAGNRSGPDVSDGFVFEEAHPSLDPGPDGLMPSRRPDQDLFPSANSIPMRSPPRTAPTSHHRRSSGSVSMVRKRSQEHEPRDTSSNHGQKSDPQQFKVRFALRGHLDVVRSVIFTGGGSPSEPEICTAGDDGMIKRWIIPASYGNYNQHGMNSDLDIQSYFTHRGHEGVVTSLAACPASTTFSTGGRVLGDGWIFSGGQDSTIRVWERGRVDPKATLEGHTDAVWAVCVLPATSASVFGQDCNNFGGADRMLLASGSADGTIKIWAVSSPPQLASPQTGSRRGVGGSRRHSVTSGSNYPSSPQPSIATATPFHSMLVHSIQRAGLPSPTCISPLSMSGETFVVSFNDASILIYDTRTGEEIIGMASAETYDGTPATAVNAIVATSGLEGSMSLESGRGMNEDDGPVHAATGSTADGGVEGVVISGHEDQFIRFFDANSGQCTYSMLAHPSAISSLSISKDGREAVSAGHDASIRFWSLEKRVCTQMITSHRIMRGEGVCSVVWSQDGRLVVSAGGDGVVKVFAR